MRQAAAMMEPSGENATLSTRESTVNDRITATVATSTITTFPLWHPTAIVLPHGENATLETCELTFTAVAKGGFPFTAQPRVSPENP